MLNAKDTDNLRLNNIIREAINTLDQTSVGILHCYAKPIKWPIFLLRKQLPVATLLIAPTIKIYQEEPKAPFIR